jgi:hypothetical protein
LNCFNERNPLDHRQQITTKKEAALIQEQPQIDIRTS